MIVSAEEKTERQRLSSELVEIKQEAGMDQKSAPSSQLVMPSDDYLSWFGYTPSTSGATVNPITAMQVPAVRAAVLAISEALGQIDVHVYSQGSSDKATDHPAYTLLHDAANDWTSASEFREQLTRDALLYGNGYAAIARDDAGVPIELTHLQPQCVTYIINPQTLEPCYRYNSPYGVEPIVYSYSDVLHLRTSSLNGMLGESPVYQAREAIGLALVMEQHAAQLFKNGGRPAGLLTIASKLDAATIANIRAAVSAQHAGTASGGTMVLGDDAKFSQLAFTSVDSQFLEMRTFAISEIARVFRVSPILLAEMGRATFSNSSEMGKQFIAYTLLPWIKRWQGEITLKLFDKSERSKFRVEFDTDDFDRLDINARATAYSSFIAARVMNPNECRELEGLPPYAGGDAFINPNITQENVTL